MKLSEARFVRIDGTNVAATVNSATEAKIAIKEIRQKKREFAHIKRGLLRERKTAERIANAARKKKTGKSGSGFFAGLMRVAGMAGGYGTANATVDLARIEKECAQTEEILHNLDTVLIQIEGKLLRFS